MKIREITSLETAIRLYYGKIELTNQDLKELWGRSSDTGIRPLKEQAKKYQLEKDCPCVNPNCVNTRCAYEAWGLDIKDLEHRLTRLKKLEALLGSSNVKEE